MTDSELVKYYRARAREYERIYYRDQPGRAAELTAEATELRKLVTGRTVLDVPCGTGYWTTIMAETAASMVGADIASEMLAEARAKEYGCPVEFVRADLSGLPFEAGSFEVLALGFWLSHHPRQDLARLFGETARVLVEGGCIWMVDNQPPHDSEQSPKVGEDEHGNTLVARYLQDGSRHTIIKNYFTEDQLRELLGPHFHIDRLTLGVYYWSAVLSCR